MNNKPNILFIGLGTMGYPMAGYLSKNSQINLAVWNRTKSKSKAWTQEFNAKSVEFLVDGVKKSDIIITCTGKDEDLDSVLFTKDGIAKHIKPNSVLIDHTTTSFKLAQKINDSLKKNQIDFIDAPVSGGEIGAINGTLSIMVGGDEELIAKLTPLMKFYSKNITRIGGVGFGQLAKMVNQICIGGVLQGLSEGLKFAQAEDINIDKLLQAIGGGAAQSWQMDNRAKTMSQDEFDFGFAIKWMIKDLSYCLEQAKANGCDLSNTQKVYQKYQNLSQVGYQNLDTSALILHDK